MPSLISPSGCRVAVLQGFLGSYRRQSGQALRSWTMRKRHCWPSGSGWMPVPLLSSRQLGLRGITLLQKGHFSVIFRTWIRMLFVAAASLRVWAVAAGAIGLRFIRVDVCKPLVDAGQEFFANLLAVFQQLVPVLLWPLASRPENQTGHGVEFVGDGAEPQPPGLEGDGATASGDVQEEGGGFRILIDEVRVVLECSPVGKRDVRPSALSLDGVHTIASLYNLRGSAEVGNELVPVRS